MIEVKVPVLGESITTAVIANIHKSEGDFVSEDEIILELETEKINLEITAPSAGKLGKINVTIDQEVKVDDIVALLDETQVGETNVEQSEVSKPEAEPELVEIKQEELTEEQTEKVAEFKQDIQANLGLSTQVDLEDLSPAVRALVLEHNVDLARVNASGKNGRILKSDILEYVENSSGFGSHHAQVKTNDKASRAKTTQRIPQIRKTIAKRLKDSQNTAAMLATFNEVDLSNVNKIRKSLKADFIEKNGVNLGYMSFFTKACCKALQHFEKVNAYYQEDQNQIELHEYCDISIAVASEKGLFVPVIRNAEQMSFAQIEHTIKDYGQKAKEGKLTSQELSGGTFSITNGGVFGSMLSTPIINQPQSAILGMHNIIQRPVAVDGKVEIRPMMYLALSYDHRIIDGKDAVSFLVMVKDLLENPEKLMFDL